MADHALTEALRALAARDVPEAADPWPALHARLAVRPSPARSRHGGVRRLALALTVAALAALALLGTVLAFGQPLPGFNRHYGMVLVDRASPRPTAGTSLAVSHEPEPTPVSVAAAQRRADFSLRLPTWLPSGLALDGCHAPPPDTPRVRSNGTAACVYSRGGVAFLTIQETKPQPGDPIGSIVVSTANAEEITVHGQPGLYARGSWNDDGTWNAHLDFAYLSWSENGITYTLITHGLGLGRADLLRVADSLR